MRDGNEDIITIYLVNVMAEDNFTECPSVLSASGVNRAFGSSIGGQKEAKSGVRNLPRILTSAMVKPFISPELSACAESP